MLGITRLDVSRAEYVLFLLYQLFLVFLFFRRLYVYLQNGVSVFYHRNAIRNNIFGRQVCYNFLDLIINSEFLGLFSTNRASPVSYLNSRHKDDVSFQIKTLGMSTENASNW